MGMDHYYTLYDRSIIDPWINLTWGELVRKKKLCREQLEEFIFYEDDPCFEEYEARESGERDGVLTEFMKRKITDTICRAGEPFSLMEEFLGAVELPGETRANVNDFNPYEVELLAAVAVEAFLNGKIGAPTLWSVFKLHNWQDAAAVLEISAKARKVVNQVLKGRDFDKSIYRWHRKNAYGFGQWANCLGTTETRLFLKFVERAWRENWPAPNHVIFKTGVKTPRYLDDENLLHFQDFELAELMHEKWIDTPYQRPVLFRSWT